MSNRALTAMSLFLASVGCIGIGFVVSGFGSPFALFDPQSPAKDGALFVLFSLTLSFCLSVLLFSKVRLSRTQRLLIFCVSVFVALASLAFAQIVLLFWLLPCWYGYRFSNEARPLI